MNRYFFALAFNIFSQPAFSLSDKPTIESVAQLIEELSRKPEYSERDMRVEDALAAIKEVYPKVFENFVLIHGSLSRQESSYEQPRAMIYADDGSFALTFNDGIDAVGYYEIELMDFQVQDVEQGSISNLPLLNTNEGFRFRRIIFKPRADYRHIESYREENVFPAIKPINEDLCLGCHGQNPRPNWEAYNRWDGSYFVTDDVRAGEKYLLGYQTDDHAGFDRFYQTNAKNDRYKVLAGVEEKFLNSSTTARTKRVDTSQFTQMAGHLNYRRIAHEIVRHDDYRRYRYVTLGALYQCEQLESFLPESEQSNLRKPLAEYRRSTQLMYERDENRFFLKDEIDRTAGLRWLYEGRGTSIRKWAMSFRRSIYAMVTPGGDAGGFISSVMIELDPELEPYRMYRIAKDEGYNVTTFFAKPWTGSMGSMFAESCSQLRVKSLDQF
jgi:hypothetical protein